MEFSEGMDYVFYILLTTIHSTHSRCSEIIEGWWGKGGRKEVERKEEGREGETE